MEISVIGWYGTETIGDRAILAGIIHLLSCKLDSFTIRLGSLYPFYSNRTMEEDISFFKEISNNRLKRIVVFDSLDFFELHRNIKRTEILCIGGGPLMDLTEMQMLEYSFSIAKKNKIATVVFGCGWGPLKQERNIKIAKRLIENSSLTIFRDSTSLGQYQRNGGLPANNVYSIIDPAVIACNCYEPNKLNDTEDYIAVNFRDVSLEGDKYLKKTIDFAFFSDLLKKLHDFVPIAIKLVPMHNFGIGGDDRIILDKVAKVANEPYIEVCHKPLSLKETMDLFYRASACVGMRFHSVLLQTVLNGKNFILDYTDPENGKIIGLLRDLSIEQTYKSCYYSIHSSSVNPVFDLELMKDKRTFVDLNTYKEQYLNCLSNHLCL